LIVGAPAPNQLRYYNRCQKLAANNVTFIEHLSQQELIRYYQQAKVHVLPSWFETTGLSSLEAAAMGCNIVITSKGDAKEYFGMDAFYCDPSIPASIYAAVEKASVKEQGQALRQKIISNFTWHEAAMQTKKAYEQIIEFKNSYTGNEGYSQ
jgi:glycosyltransferase involved in cell wall biosynthesis